MELYEAIRKRRSIRDFEDEAIPEETLKKIVKAAFEAPSNDHLRDWHYIIVTDKNVIEKLLGAIPKNLTEKDADAMVSSDSDSVQRDSYRLAVPKQYKMLADAGAVIIPLMKKKVDILHPANLSHLNCFASIWCGIENLWLAATSEGYGCNLRIPWGDEEATAKAALGFPDDYFMPCFFGIGKPAKNAKLAKQMDFDTDKQIHWQKF